MKRFLLILSVNIIAFSTTLATEQVPDLLIIGKDTFYLKSFPLENLRPNNKELKSPFNNAMVSTGCYRGYIATWQIIDGTLTLKEVREFDSSKKGLQGAKFNIIEDLKNNGYNLRTINGFIIADWYSDILKRYESPSIHGTNDRFYLSNDDFSENNDVKIELVFKNGKLIENNIIPIEVYKIGNYLCYYYPQNWYEGFRGVTIYGVIRENNGKMVRLEILFISSNNDEIITQIKQGKIIKLDNFWVNPRYCAENCKYSNWFINVVN